MSPTRGVNIIPFFILNCLLVLKSSLFFVLINAFMLKSLKILLWQPRCPEPFSDRGALFWFFTLIIKNPLCVLSHTHTPSGWMKYDQSINLPAILSVPISCLVGSAWLSTLGSHITSFQHLLLVDSVFLPQVVKSCLLFLPLAGNV